MLQRGWKAASRIFIALALVAGVVVGVSSPASAKTNTVILAGSSWLDGHGVDVYSDDGDFGSAVNDNNYVNIGDAAHPNNILSGLRWQCVELINRLYLTHGWTSAWWAGNGYQMYDTAPAGLLKELNGSITSVAPGDVVVFGAGIGGNGHVAIVDSVAGNTIHTVSQNLGDSNARRDFTWDPSAKTISHWSGYTTTGIVHAPTTTGSQADIFAVVRNDVGSNHTAAHVVNGSNWGQYLMNTATGLPVTDQNWSFDWADFNHDGVLDLWGFNRNPGGTHTVVHVLNGANLGQWLRAGDIWLPATDATWSFKLADFNHDGTPDIYAINRAPGWPHTVVHVVNGANWGQGLQSGEIGLPGTDANWDFDVADFNHDGAPDIFGINRAPGYPHTVVHIINGANWGQWLQSGDIGLPATDSSWSFAVGDWNGDGTPDIFGINRAPGYAHTVVHVINGANWGEWFQAGNIVLPATDSNWDFAVGNK